MNIVVTNSSPIISLSRIGLFHVLEEIFDEIIVPSFVHHEVCNKFQTNNYGEQQLDEALGKSKKFKLVRATDMNWVQKNVGSLHEGELEVIQIAREREIDIVLMDELKGRKMAGGYNISAMGTLGIILRAKEMSLIPSVGIYFERLIETGFRIDKKILVRLLKEAGEISK